MERVPFYSKPEPPQGSRVIPRGSASDLHLGSGTLAAPSSKSEFHVPSHGRRLRITGRPSGSHGERGWRTRDRGEAFATCQILLGSGLPVLALPGRRVPALRVCQPAERLRYHRARFAAELRAHLPIEFGFAGFSDSVADRRTDGTSPFVSRPRRPLGSLRQRTAIGGGREQVKASGLHLRTLAAQVL